MAMVTTIPITPLSTSTSSSSPSPTPCRQCAITKSLSNAASSIGANAEAASATATGGGISSINSSGRAIAVSEERRGGEGEGLKMKQARGTGSPKFKFPKLQQLNNQHQHRSQRSERNEMQPPSSQLQQQQQQQQLQEQRHNNSAAVPASKYASPAARLRRGFGFLQSHYHVSHRQSEQQQQPITMPRIETFTSEDDRGRRVDRSSVTTAASLQPRAWMLAWSGGGGSNSGGSAYNAALHRETMAPTKSNTLPTKVTNVDFKGGSDECRQEQGVYSSTTVVPSTTVRAAQMMIDAVNPTPTSSQGGKVGGGAGPKVSLCTLGFFNKVVASSRSPSIIPSPTSSTMSVTGSPESSNEGAPSLNLPRFQKEARDQNPESRVRSPQHLSKVFEAGARRIRLIKQKLSSHEHHLSLPVGGAASPATNDMYMPHSEDLSTAEFAKLAGITILPNDDDGDDDDYATSVCEGGPSFSADGCTSDSGNSGSNTGSGKVEPKSWSGSSSNTFDSVRHLTFTSTASSRSIRRTNIWDSQFWIHPSRDEGSQISVPSSESTSSLPVMSSIPISASSTPSPTHVSTIAELPRQDLDKIPPDLVFVSATVQRLGRMEKAHRESKEYTGAIQGRRSACSPSCLRTGASSQFEVNRKCTLPTGVSLRRVDEMTNPPKEAVDLARDLGRRRSFASLTAVALELESNHALDYKHVPAVFGSNNHGRQQQRQDHHDHSTVTPPQPAHFEATGPNAIGSKFSRSRRHAHSVALHALQPSRSKIRSYHTTGSPGCSERTRSPSPSPLSRQVNLDSPQDERDDFDFLAGASLNEVGGKTTTRLLMWRNQRHAFTPDGGPSEIGFEQSNQAFYPSPPLLPERNRTVVELYSAGTTHHRRTHSLPLLYSGQPEHSDAYTIQEFPLQEVAPSSLSSPPSPSPSLSSSVPYSSSQPDSLRRPSNSSPSRMFTPGTKVGRFTLVQGLCTKHVDVLRAQQEQQQQPSSSSQSASVDERVSSNRGARIDPLEVPAFPVIEEQEQEQQQQPSDLQNANTIMMTLDENVVIFQRKKKSPALPPLSPPTQTVPQAP